ncbi:MAG: penicillin-binding protein 1C [Gallionella sp.]|nr:penicillin-binding protein 1C [Gallionella sp.]MDD4959274.1 penicillin-binding protein 1C [Gallionella sp.]
MTVKLHRKRLFIWVLLLWCLSGCALAQSTFAEVKAQYTSSDAWLLAQNGEVLQQLRLDFAVRRLAWTPLEAVSPALLSALIYSEDKQFYAHSGVDWRAVAAASWRNLWNTRTRGASTLTMQLAGLLDELEDSRRTGRRNVLQKIGQGTDALWLDARWQKAEILEAYLNLVSFRGELQGVAAMSFGLFGKSPAALDVREAALAAVLLRAPNVPPRRAAERACVLLKQLGAPEQCADLEGFAALKLTPPYQIPAPDHAPHLARMLLKTAGLALRTTLDADLQRYANQQLRANLLQLERRNAQDGAVLVLDNQTGQVLAWVGSSGKLSSAPDVDAILAQRQAGSTLKPFLYGIALEKRALTAASILDDTPVRITTPNGLYVPQNYDKHFVGAVSLRMALGSSLNVPAVRTLLRVTPDVFQQRLAQLGFTTLKESGDYYGYSLALGSADVRLLDLTNAYRALANQGQWRDVSWLVGKTAQQPPRQVFTAQTAAIVADILADRSARHHTYGLDSVLSTHYWTAVKTGTSKDMRDNWCIGFSQRYTVGVWVGNAKGEPMHDVSGISGAAPVWVAMMDYLHHRQNGLSVRSDPPPVPKGVVPRQIRFEPALEPPRRELFLAGTAQTVIRASGESGRGDRKMQRADSAMARITYPSTGVIVALDPEIPPARQRVVFKTSVPVSRGWQWMLDSKPLGSAQQLTAWFPMPGQHVLLLQNDQGIVVDQVSFEVRGATMKTSEPPR